MSVRQPESNDKYRAALHATLSVPKRVSATVSYYPFGGMITDITTLEPMQGLILILAGDEDFSLTPDKVKSHQDNMANASKILQVKTYNAKHGFNRENGKNYNQAAHVKAESLAHLFLEINLN